MLYELLTTQLLFRSKDRIAALERVRTEALEPLGAVVDWVPEELCSIVDKALARNPEDRYESARELQASLAAYLHRADPVVEDDAMRQFALKYCPPALPSPSAPRTPTASVADRMGDTSYPAGATRSVQRVTAVYIALNPRPLMPDSPQVDAAKFASLAGDVAFKRDALVVAQSSERIVLAFGALLRTPDDADRAVRTALALQEDVAEVCPGLQIGVVVARVPATVRREPKRIHVEPRPGILSLLDQIARRSLEGPVMVAGNLIEDLSRSWRFGQDRFIDPQPTETLSGIDRDLEQIAPVLGPVLSTPRREPVAPGGRTLLFGRELELKALRDSFSEAIRARESRAVLVLGEPGIGKRALVERFVASLPRTACWILRASGSYARRNVPLGVFLDLISRFLGVDHETPPIDVIEKLEAHGVSEADRLAAALSNALGFRGSDDADLDPFTRRDRLWKLVRRLTTALAQRRPVLIVIENIHLHDEQSVILLKEWIQVRHPWPILGVTTGRPDDLRVEAILAEPNVLTVHLRELGPKARRELIVSRFEDPDAASDLADAILARTAGNPLFIEQTLATLLDRGVIAWNAQGRALLVKQRGAAIELPPSVEAALANRLEQLSRHDREVLQGAAILGRQFRLKDLADLRERSVAKSVEKLIDRHFLERLSRSSPSDDDIRFATVSLHEVCRGSLPTEEAQRLHSRAAELLRQRDDYTPESHDGRIADHLVHAGRAAEAVEPALAAAMRAYDLAGNVEAYYHLTQALGAMHPEDPRRWEALLRRERILRAWGRRRAQGADVRALLRAADDAADPEKQAIALIRLLRFYLEVGRVQQADRIIPRVEDKIGQVSSPAPFLAVLGELRSELMFMRGDFEAAEHIARDALVYCAADARGQRQRCRLMRSIGQVKNSVGKWDEAREHYQEALAIARGISNQRLEANLLNALGEVEGRSAHYQAAVDYFKAALAIDRDLGDRYATGRKLANLGITYACIGLPRRAERFLRKALELHEAVGHPGEFNDVAVHLGEVVAQRGDVESARVLLLDAARVAATRGDIRTELRARIRLAGALLQDGATAEDLDAADLTASQVLTTARAHGLRTSRCRALHVQAQLATLRGDPAAATTALEEAVGLVRAGAAPLDGVRSIHLLGKLHQDAGREAEAAPLLAEAAAMVAARLDDLRDDDLRAGYLDQPDVQTILGDGGVTVAG